MSELIYDGTAHTLSYYTKNGEAIGSGWRANNVVDSSIKNLRFLPNGVYPFLDKLFPFRHGSAKDSHGIPLDSVNGAFGSWGIFRLMPFSFRGVKHAGVGVHSGRANKGGPDHATHGCVRTTDDVMQALVYYIMNDSLTTLTVLNNYDQRRKHSHPGDAHWWEQQFIA